MLQQLKQSKYIRIVIVLLFIQSTIAKSQPTNRLSADEKQEGWSLLFDGNTTSGWRGYNKDSITSNWKVENGELQANGSKGDIVTVQQFDDFELSLEWKISEGGNSGVFYHVKEGQHFDKIWRTGIEMQVMDNARNPLAKDPNKSASSVYAMYGPIKDATNSAGTWNIAKIRVEKGKVEYWMNGELVNKYQLWNNQWYLDRETSIHNKLRKPLWGEFRKGHIALQDEGFPVAYRNIKIREIKDTSRNKSNPNFVAVTYLDESPLNQREGHYVHTLLNDWWGTTNGFNSMVGVYTSKDYVVTGVHQDQEMFYVIEGSGWALIGDKETPIFPGACWLVPPNTKHGIKCAANCGSIKAFVVHGAP